MSDLVNMITIKLIEDIFLMKQSQALPKIERKLTIRSDDPFASMFLDKEKHMLIGDRGMRTLIDQ